MKLGCSLFKRNKFPKKFVKGEYTLCFWSSLGWMWCLCKGCCILQSWTKNHYSETIIKQNKGWRQIWRPLWTDHITSNFWSCRWSMCNKLEKFSSPNNGVTGTDFLHSCRASKIWNCYVQRITKSLGNQTLMLHLYILVQVRYMMFQNNKLMLHQNWITHLRLGFSYIPWKRTIVSYS